MKVKAIIHNNSVFEILVHNINASNDVRYLNKIEDFEDSSFVSVHLGNNEYCKYSAYASIKDYNNLLKEKEWGLADEDINWGDDEEFEQYIKNVRNAGK